MTTVIFVPTNSIVVLTTGIYVEFTNMVNNINYVCGWYQNNHKLIILTTFFVEKRLLFFSVYFCNSFGLSKQPANLHFKKNPIGVVTILKNTLNFMHFKYDNMWCTHTILHVLQRGTCIYFENCI